MIVKTKCRMGNACTIRNGEGECVRFCYFNTREVKTNYDRIVNMSQEELAEFLEERVSDVPWCNEDAPFKPGTDECVLEDCTKCALVWLRKEVTDG